MTSVPRTFPRRRAAVLALPSFIVAASCLGLLLCAGWPLSASAQSARTSPVYRVYWTAIRASDNAPLLSASSLAVLGRESEARTDAPAPAENQPALVTVKAAIIPTKDPGVFSLETFVRVREAYRNKKGKLKINKRNMRALVPTRVGENQVVSAAGDSIRLEVRIERSETRI